MVVFSEMLLVCQMRYYDAMEDSNCKGFIDLAEVESVQPVKSMPGAPKKADENSFIEVTLPFTLLNTPPPLPPLFWYISVFGHGSGELISDIFP